MATKRQERAVLVTTSYKGIFFGYATDTTSGDTVTLKRCRNCIYWSEDVKGFLGLAANGPSKSCRIGPAVESVELRGITSVSDVSVDAVKKWEASPWRN